MAEGEGEDETQIGSVQPVNRFARRRATENQTRIKGFRVFVDRPEAIAAMARVLEGGAGAGPGQKPRRGVVHVCLRAPDLPDPGGERC